MNNNDLPNLFIIGAPKCGTTSLFHWLSEHPEICSSKRKETWFFAGRELDHLDIRPNHRHGSLSDYLSCFKPVDECTRVKMEGSSHYLYSETALNFLSEFSPKPRIIVLLRNPANRIWSHFNYIRQRAVAPVDIPFAEYVDALLNGNAKHDGIFSQEPWVQHLLENQLSYSNYHQHLGGWFERFPRDNILVMMFEELVMDTPSLVPDIADWAGVNPAYYDGYAFKATNVTRSRVSESIRRCLKGYAAYIPRAVINTARQVVDKSLATGGIKMSPSDLSAISRLKDFFKDPNQRLRSEFNLDLSSWA